VRNKFDPGWVRTKASWRSMMNRCFRTQDTAYKSYGAKGITVCDDWQTFENFLKDMGIRPPQTSIDRIDNNGNYEPGNCRWATFEVQQTNKSSRNLRYATIGGEKKRLTDWAGIYGVNPKTVHKRLSVGLSIEEALTTPVNKDCSHKVSKTGVSPTN
jgi:hypothetical protein